jgi:hypothetical protein
MPLLCTKLPRNISNLAMSSPGAGRRRSGQIPANQRPGPAGRGRGMDLGPLGVDFRARLGAGCHRRARPGIAPRRWPLGLVSRRTGSRCKLACGLGAVGRGSWKWWKRNRLRGSAKGGRSAVGGHGGGVAAFRDWRRPGSGKDCAVPL